MGTKNIERTSHDTDNLWAWDDLIRFQLNIAERWIKRGDEAKDIFAEFFFYFTGFNALYFLWRKIDKLDSTNEGKHIENLFKKFDESKAQEILEKIRSNVDYFSQRRPIQRMDRRTDNNPYAGEEDEGHKWQGLLQKKVYLHRKGLMLWGKFCIWSDQILSMAAKRDQEMTLILFKKV